MTGFWSLIACIKQVPHVNVAHVDPELTLPANALIQAHQEYIMGINDEDGDELVQASHAKLQTAQQVFKNKRSGLARRAATSKAATSKASTPAAKEPAAAATGQVPATSRSAVVGAEPVAPVLAQVAQAALAPLVLPDLRAQAMDRLLPGRKTRGSRPATSATTATTASPAPTASPATTTDVPVAATPGFISATTAPMVTALETLVDTLTQVNDRLNASTTRETVTRENVSFLQQMLLYSQACDESAPTPEFEVEVGDDLDKFRTLMQASMSRCLENIDIGTSRVSGRVRDLRKDLDNHMERLGVTLTTGFAGVTAAINQGFATLLQQTTSTQITSTSAASIPASVVTPGPPRSSPRGVGAPVTPPIGVSALVGSVDRRRRGVDPLPRRFGSFTGYGDGPLGAAVPLAPGVPSSKGKRSGSAAGVVETPTSRSNAGIGPLPLRPLPAFSPLNSSSLLRDANLSAWFQDPTATAGGNLGTESLEDVYAGGAPVSSPAASGEEDLPSPVRKVRRSGRSVRTPKK
ncbi:LOW QUALITY PROTEIN: hypothetical protein MGYG_07300 [Nannizzia gypsea CBS 118893]|uniref:Uncharacterized protein n=1 Tax=Arthroderma gypseum (strain ATCC MYA-4604 / CBS 118893) TaxID=535722 RepID=E4V2R9_ARTGP|nr:LOW QUALITY PROTEIN: hypothetical protein MGYG_07300 [Nannizzia gypsea CBS 118893]EFR04293.1 LOW QUALITY PROTEIN: hypothetical protein MGYG_07300 [Nannizzia gypsea CBS 118893]